MYIETLERRRLLSAAPDLIDLDGIYGTATATVSATNANPGDTLTINTRFQNIGDTPTQGPFDVRLIGSYYADGDYTSEEFGVARVTQTIDAGEIVAVALTFEVLAGVPDQHFVVGWQIDPDGVLDESNEFNNGALGGFLVTIGNPSAPPPPIDRYEFNDTPENATDLGVFNDRVEADLSTHLPFDRDYYTLHSDRAQRIQIELWVTEQEHPFDGNYVDFSTTSGLTFGNFTNDPDDPIVWIADVEANDRIDLFVAADAGGPVGYELRFSFVDDFTAPALVAATFDYEQAHSAIFEFDEELAVSIRPSDFWLTNLTTPMNGMILPTVRTVGNTVTATWAAPLRDGNYRLTLDPDKVRDAAGNVLTDMPVLTFYTLAGDLDRDRDVDLFDAANLERNFGMTDGAVFSQGDLNFDGDVDLFDAALLERNFGSTLPPVTFGLRSVFGDRAFGGGSTKLRSLFA